MMRLPCRGAQRVGEAGHPAKPPVRTQRALLTHWAQESKYLLKPELQKSRCTTLASGGGKRSINF
jgi:hypothetical protein